MGSIRNVNFHFSRGLQESFPGELSPIRGRDFPCELQIFHGQSLWETLTSSSDSDYRGRDEKTRKRSRAGDK